MNINIMEAMLILFQLHANMCQVKPLELFKGGYHPIIPHYNHFNSMLALKVNYYKLLGN